MSAVVINARTTTRILREAVCSLEMHEAHIYSVHFFGVVLGSFVIVQPVDILVRGDLNSWPKELGIIDV